MKNKKTTSITTVIIAMAVIFFQYLEENKATKSDISISTNENKSINKQGNSKRLVETLYAKQQSDTIIEITGKVIKLLADDIEGSRHQKFIVKLASGHTLLVSHNIDLATRINSLRQNDIVKIKGEYEWTKRGGVVHWTHHDPTGRHEDGWIEHKGKRYY